MLSEVVGVIAYNAKPAEHIAGVTVRGSPPTIRLKARSPTLLRLLATTPFCAVPPTTPMRPGTAAHPTAGPHHYAEYLPGRRPPLKRNPGYHGPRQARTPAIPTSNSTWAAHARSPPSTAAVPTTSGAPPSEQRLPA